MRSLVTVVLLSLILTAASPVFAAGNKAPKQTAAQKSQAKKNKVKARKFAKRAKQARHRSS
jgi:hypothetical protein